MQAELNSDVALSAANALLSHLRKNPEAAMTPARDLAATFGLDETFVAQVLQGIHSNRKVEVKVGPVRRSLFRVIGEGLRSLWLKLTSRPIIFVIVTFILCIVGVFVTAAVVPHFVPRAAETKASESGFPPDAIAVLLAALAIMGGTFLLHMAVYFRHRSSRNALYGGLILFIALEGVMSLGFLTGKGKTQPNEASPMLMFLLGSMGMLFLALIYTGMGSLASILGGWTRFKLQERAEETMSRQDMLERYFELQSRLQKSAYPRPSGHEPALFSTPAVVWYRKNQFVANVGIGFVVSALGLLVVKASGVQPGQPNPEVNAWILVLLVISISEFLLYVLQGYLSKSAWRAVLGAACVAAGTLLSRLLPIEDLNGSGMSLMARTMAEAFGVSLYILISLAGFLGAVVQNRAIRESNLQRNDQATLLAEMVRIQWKLSNEAAAVCVLVVDAAKSSEMKADADPLVVEYTFREYQEWIEAICNKRGGKVHSTAGDGAVVAFDTCGLALSAAKRMQTDVFQFNKDVNRLSHPFRLRIGLHTGEVVGDINEVQFTEVIDIAAHIEAACPIGGIAVTDEVAQRLPEIDFDATGMVVDGHEVLLVKNPTEYQ